MRTRPVLVSLIMVILHHPSFKANVIKLTSTVLIHTEIVLSPTNYFAPKTLCSTNDATLTTAWKEQDDQKVTKSA